MNFVGEAGKLISGGRLQVDPQNLSTPISGVFAGGDLVTGPKSVIEAIAAGRKAASVIDRYLGGDSNISCSTKTKRCWPSRARLTCAAP